MAKVKLVESEKTSKWKPFVTITLSKREAAGVLAVIGGMHYNSMRTDDLHSKIHNILGEESWELPFLPYTDSKAEENAGNKLDKLFGKV